MKINWLKMLSVVGLLHWSNAQAAPIVRLFELEVAAAQQQAFLAVGERNLSRSVAQEKGTLAMYLMSDPAQPKKNYVLEIYQNDQAYQQHTQSAVYQQFVTLAKTAVTGRKVLEMTPHFLAEQSAPLRQIADPHYQVELLELVIKPEQNQQVITLMPQLMAQAAAQQPAVLYALNLTQQPNHWRIFRISQPNQGLNSAWLNPISPMIEQQQWRNLTGEILMNKGNLLIP